MPDQTNAAQAAESSASGMAGNPVDAIASLLVDDEPEDQDSEESQAPLGQDEESTESEGTEDKDEREAEAAEQQPEPLTWAQALGLDDNQLQIDDDGNLKGVNVKVDGQSSTVSMKDLVAGYQLNKYVTQKSQALAEERKEFDGKRTASLQSLEEKLSTADKLTEYLKDALLKEFQSTDWNQLRATNPGEYAAKLTDYQQQKQRLDTVTEAILTERQQQVDKLNQEQQEGYHKYLQEQMNILVTKFPEWADDSKRQAGFVELAKQAQAMYGIEPELFERISDARHIEILKDAIAFRQGKQQVQSKVDKVPKFVKSGKASKPMDKVTQLVLNARKARGGNKADLQAEAIAELLSGM